jgi:hypothetical protein
MPSSMSIGPVILEMKLVGRHSQYVPTHNVQRECKYSKATAGNATAVMYSAVRHVTKLSRL